MPIVFKLIYLGCLSMRFLSKNRFLYISFCSFTLLIGIFEQSIEIGKLNARDLKLEVALYDNNKHYLNIKKIWLGFEQ